MIVKKIIVVDNIVFRREKNIPGSDICDFYECRFITPLRDLDICGVCTFKLAATLFEIPLKYTYIPK